MPFGSNQQLIFTCAPHHLVHVLVNHLHGAGYIKPANNICASVHRHHIPFTGGVISAWVPPSFVWLHGNDLVTNRLRAN